MVFRQFAIGRFMVSFIVFILCYMAAGNLRDGFFQMLVAGLFVLTLYIFKEMKQGHLEELAHKDQEWLERFEAYKQDLEAINRYNELQSNRPSSQDIEED
ncbi:hypothetical protein CLV98_103296 [Dyadobacter jejuensis]|uniref:Uncharacterized protein n=1 Tax=Dyadobacter jejuensis TaxID=1082580 RepID=A0A316AMC1_9BACT|nr:hypothetical protein [Dyadobacter jejuensis]PWJ58925.1 hypothetical protein CLV98_103296 [Dyadobacter jejuensis]